MGEIRPKDFKRAVRNVIDFGDTDIFPLPFENLLIRDRPDDAEAVLKDLAENFEDRVSELPPQFESTLSPVGYAGYRWATQICPFWNAYFLASVLRHAEDIEAARIPTDAGRVHSYRLNSNTTSKLFSDDYNWRSFMTNSYLKAQQSNFIVITDISDFYGRIYHHRMEVALQHCYSTTLFKKQLKFLQIFTSNASYGLPVGGPAARILSEITINQIDQLLLRKRYDYVRFSDDYHIFTNSKEEAHSAIQFLSEKLVLNQGLTLQKSKTRILTSSEFISSFPAHLNPENPEPRTERERLFQVSLRFDPYDQNSEENYENLKSQLNDIDFLQLLNSEITKSHVHAPTINRLIQAIRALPARTRTAAIQTLFENAEVLYPMLSSILLVVIRLADTLSEDDHDIVKRKLLKIIDEEPHLFNLDIHKCYAVRILAKYNDPNVGQILSEWFESGQAFLRRDIILAYMKLRDWPSLSNIRHQYARLSDWEKRAFICASYELKDEGNHWRRSQRFNKMQKFVQDGVSSINRDKLAKLL